MKKRIRSSIICVHDKKILAFKAVDPTSGKIYWFLPGGGIEENEKPHECAQRETLEETGYQVKALPETEIVKKYEFFWDGNHYESTTYFYKAVLKSPFSKPSPVQDADYNKGAAWLPLTDIEKDFSYTDEVISAIKALI